MLKILYVHGEALLFGGVESYMLNFCRHFDHTKVQVDFLLHGTDSSPYDDEVIEMGGAIYRVPKRSESLPRNIQDIRSIIGQGKYDIVHSHMNAMSAVPLSIAKSLGVPVRIAHAHSTSYGISSNPKLLANMLCRRELKSCATEFFACSRAAGNWLYGENAFFRVIPNGISPNKFRFDDASRCSVRHGLGIADETCVIGHIGRFVPEKNQAFLLQVAKSLARLGVDFVILFIGEGETRSEVERAAHESSLEGKVLFLDPTPDVDRYYNAFDVFALPSVFEGLPVTLIEAQANGLPCVVSDSVTSESDISGDLRFASVTSPDSPREWCSLIEETVARGRDAEARRHLEEAGYSIDLEAPRLEALYHRLVEVHSNS